MTQTVEDPRGSRAAEALLARLTAELGLPAELAQVRRASAQAEREAAPHDEAPDAWAVRAAGLLGVRLVLAAEPVARLVARVDRGAPALGWRAGPGGGWLLVLAREGGRVLLAGPDGRDRWVAVGELGGPVRWFFAEPLAPLEPEAHHATGHHAPHGHGHSASPLQRLVRMLRPEGHDIGRILLFALGVGLLSLATPVTVDALIMTVKGGTPMRTQVLVLAGILFVCLGLAAGLRALKQYLVELLQQRFLVRVVSDLSYRLPRVAQPAFDGQNAPELVNRFFEVLTVQKAGSVLLLDGISVVVQAAVGLALLAFYHPFLLGFDLALLAAVVFIVFVLGRGGVASSIEESYAKYALAGWLEELVRHPRSFKHPGGRDLAFERADGLTATYLRARQKHFAILFRQVLFALGLQAVASAALLGLGGWLVVPDEQGRSALDVGQLVAAELIVVVVVGSLVKLGKSLESYYDLMAAADKLGHLIDLPLERDSGEGHPGSGPAGLRLRGVHYAYEQEGGHEAVFAGLEADIAPGARVAVVGPSGSGKSTLAELIYGLREPQRGSIELDGADLRAIRLDDLRAQVALVAGLEIIDGTIADNLRLGCGEAPAAAIREALARVGLLEEVQGLPDGIETRVNGSGEPLSLGQARRLQLARALLARPRLLLLDESLDELDEQTRGRILDAVLDPAAPWTVLVVTHREDVAGRCDRRLELGTPTLLETTR